MSAVHLKFSSEQLHVAARTAETVRNIARIVPDLDHLMGSADHDVRDLVGYGTTLDALVIYHFPAWAAGTATTPGMGRRQWSAITIPDPKSANTLAFPRYGILRSNGRILSDD